MQKKLNTLRKLEGKTHENIGVKKQRVPFCCIEKFAGSDVCCCFCVKIYSRRIVSRACRNFFRVVFSSPNFSLLSVSLSLVMTNAAATATADDGAAPSLECVQ